MVNLGFEISMTYSFSMEDHEPFQDLSRNLLGVPLSNPSTLNIGVQVAVLDILHREEYIGLVFIPAKEFDE